MNARLERFDIEGRKAWVYLPAEYDPGASVTIYALAGDEFADDLPELLALMRTMDADVRPPSFVGFGPADWNRDYTPWTAPPLKRGMPPFAGEGRETLSFLTDALKPQVERRFGADARSARNLLLGYSLGGLFALWACYESAVFGGCASCSGSLWYDGWREYAASRSPNAGSRVYLSLGRGEERTRDRRMAAVGDNTRALAKQLAQDARVAQTELEWHDGGHFHEVSRRIARAALWLARQM